MKTTTADTRNIATVRLDDGDRLELYMTPDSDVWVEQLDDGYAVVYAVQHDDGWDMWEWPEGVEFVHSSPRLAGYLAPDRWDDWAVDMAAKGCRMYPVDYHEHGLCIWSLSTGQRTDPWDTAYNAGWIAIPDDALGHECGFIDSWVAANSILSGYTAACNGDVWMVVGELHNADAPTIDIVGGYLGWDAVLDAAVETFALMGVRVDASDL